MLIRWLPLITVCFAAEFSWQLHRQVVDPAGIRPDIAAGFSWRLAGDALTKQEYNRPI
jgi:hypothetical protein